jgi:prophage regulatory protein
MEKEKAKNKNAQAAIVNSIPLSGLLRLPQVLQLVPVSASTWWAGCKSGRFPKPLHLSKRVTVWRVSDIQRIIAGESDFSETSF